MRWRTSDIARVVGGTHVGPDVEVRGVSQDSRTIEAGQLFVPLVAERDGHEFIAGARAAGAAAYLTSRPPVGGSAVVVDDTEGALARLGAAARNALPDRVVGITGSVGKTTTKDLVASILATTWATHASEKSFNNEIGVPLTLCNAPAGTEAVVVEMGARGAGHVGSLCAIARPTIGVVTVVGAAHLELFGSVDDVARAKGELVEALPADGAAVLNADDPRVAAMATRTRARVLTFGRTADVRAEHVVLDDDLTSSFRLVSPWGATDIALPVRGAHNITNALAAAAAGLVAGVPLDAVARGLHEARLSPWRMELQRTVGGGWLLNDAYNANPVSMRAALRSLVRLPARAHIAVLGPMAELGADADEEHRRVGVIARDLGVRVIAVDAPSYGGLNVVDIDAAVAALGPLGPQDAVLVKGSRVAALERLADRIRGRAG